MADYKEIKGKYVLSIASDLDNVEGEGQIWFNTAGDFKTIAKVAGAWASGGNLNTASANRGASGTQTAGLVFAGSLNTPPSNAPRGGVITESYDGAAWTEVGDLNTLRRGPGMGGTQTAAICIAGSQGPPGSAEEVETWDGSSWTEVADINTTREVGASLGPSSTAAFMASYCYRKHNNGFWQRLFCQYNVSCDYNDITCFSFTWRYLYRY